MTVGYTEFTAVIAWPDGRYLAKKVADNLQELFDFGFQLLEEGLMASQVATVTLPEGLTVILKPDPPVYKSSFEQLVADGWEPVALAGFDTMFARALATNA